MADLDVVRRKPSTAWMWWVLAALLIVALVFLLTRSADRADETDRGRRPAGSSQVTVPGTLVA